MKKIYTTLLLFFALISLLACDFLPTSTESTTTTFLTSERTTTTTISSSTDTTTMTTTETTSTTNSITSELTTASSAVPFKLETYNTLQDELDVIGLPSLGDVKVLVFAVDFPDYTSLSSPVSINEIDTAFNGSSSELTYESLQSYYLKSSYDQLEITADVYGFYRASHNASYYENEYEKLYATDPYTGDWLYGDDEVTYPDSDIIFEVMEYYDDVIDYSDYDSNGDGYIDGIYIIYNHPVSYTSGSDLWWAYEDVYIYEDTLFDNVEPYYFVWSGAEFFVEGDDNLNARTVIHETGHLLGLEDYYDYDDSDNLNSGGLGGADMMDNAYGDHNAFSKLLLGWIHPWVVTESMTVDISSFAESGDVILFTKQWNGTIFDEYLLLSFYTPTGLNEEDQDWLFTTSGVIIYHISARLGNNPAQDYYVSVFYNNNTETTRKLIKIIEADMDRDIDNYSLAENTDLFQEGDSLGGTVYSTYRWYDNSALNAVISITDFTSNSVTIQFVLGN